MELWADDGDYPNYNSSLAEGLFSTPALFAAKHDLQNSQLSSNFQVGPETFANDVSFHPVNADSYVTTAPQIIFRRQSLFDRSNKHSKSERKGKVLHSKDASSWNSLAFHVDQQQGVHIGGLPQYDESALVDVKQDLYNSECCFNY